MTPIGLSRRSALALACFALGTPAYAQAPVFETLGVLPGANFSQATAVTADGSVVVGTSGTSGAGATREAFRWDASGGIRGLGQLLPGGALSEAHAVAGDASAIAGRSSGPLGVEAFRFAGEMNGLGDLPGGSFSSWARAISADGTSAAGQGQGAAGAEAFRWTAAAGLVGLGDLPGGSTRSEAYGISGDGAVVVGRSSSTSSGALWEAFRWDAVNGMVALGDLPGGVFNSHAIAVSADGRFVVGTAAGVTAREAFRFEAATGMLSLGSLPGGALSSVANAVSADGNAIAGSATVLDPATGVATPHAFVWTPEQGMRRLAELLADLQVDLAGLRLETATGITADGFTIVGSGANAAGQQQAWIARLAPPAPEPVPDLDADGVFDASDNCPALANADQADLDADALGDVCDADDDGDLAPDASDNCPLLANSDQLDLDQDASGDACDLDADGDAAQDDADNCLALANPLQEDRDLDGTGDVCDEDADGDAVADLADACVETPLGAAVRADGCALPQLCPCAGPSGGGSWRHHGGYLGCVRRTTREFYGAGLLGREQRIDAIRDAQRSHCGTGGRDRCERDEQDSDRHRRHRH